MKLPLLLALVPVQRLDLVSLGVLPENELQNVAFTHAHLLHERIYQTSALPCNPCRDTRHFRHSTPMSQFFHLRGSNLRPQVAGAQETSHHRCMEWQLVAICVTILVTITVFDREFVAGLSAQDGLLFREQRPTTQESATSWVVAFLRTT